MLASYPLSLSDLEKSESNEQCNRRRCVENSHRVTVGFCLGRNGGPRKKRKNNGNVKAQLPRPATDPISGGKGGWANVFSKREETKGSVLERTYD